MVCQKSFSYFYFYTVEVPNSQVVRVNEKIRWANMFPHSRKLKELKGKWVQIVELG